VCSSNKNPELKKFSIFVKCQMFDKKKSPGGSVAGNVVSRKNDPSRERDRSVQTEIRECRSAFLVYKKRYWRSEKRSD